MKALVLWAEQHSPNLGVRALGSGSAALLNEVWSGVDVSFQGYGPGDAPMRIGNPKTMLKQYVKPKSELLSWLRSFDLVMDTRAGDSFADIYGVDRLIGMSGIAELTRKSGVPLILGPQTIGPFNTRPGRLIGRRMLKIANAVMARDTVSGRYSKMLGRVPQAQTTDVVFALPRPDVVKSRDVVLNVSGLLWTDNPHVDSVKYRSLVTDLAQTLIRQGRKVSLLAHVLDSPIPDNDVPAIRELSESLNEDVEILIPDSLEEVRIMVASGEVVIGSRMHACLNAISMGTPAVPLAYSRKFEPLLSDIEWAQTVDLKDPGCSVEVILQALEDPTLHPKVARTLEVADQLLLTAIQALRASV